MRSLSFPWLAAAFPQPRRGAKWTAAAKKTPSRVASCLQPLGVLVVGLRPKSARRTAQDTPAQPRVPSSCPARCSCRSLSPHRAQKTRQWQRGERQRARLGIPLACMCFIVCRSTQECAIFSSHALLQSVCEKRSPEFLHNRFLHQITESFRPAPAALFTQRPSDTSVSRSATILRNLDGIS